jgi:hypothetical protein
MNFEVWRLITTLVCTVVGKNVNGNRNSIVTVSTMLATPSQRPLSHSGEELCRLVLITCETIKKKTTGAGPERGWAMVPRLTSSDLRDGQTTPHIHKKTSDATTHRREEHFCGSLFHVPQN